MCKPVESFAPPGPGDAEFYKPRNDNRSEVKAVCTLRPLQEAVPFKQIPSSFFVQSSSHVSERIPSSLVHQSSRARGYSSIDSKTGVIQMSKVFSCLKNTTPQGIGASQNREAENIL